MIIFDKKHTILLWGLFIFIAILPGCNTLFSSPKEPFHETPGEYWAKNPPCSNTNKLLPPLNDKKIDFFIQKALTRNPNLQIAHSRTKQAEEDLKMELGQNFPQLKGSLRRSAKKFQSKTDSKTSTSNQQTWETLLNASYDLDIWGKSYSKIKLRQEYLMAAYQDEINNRLSLICDVAKTYVDIIACQKKLQLQESQIEINQDLLELIYARFFSGVATSLDISQQKTSLARSIAGRPILEKKLGLLMNQMALLMGVHRNQVPVIANKDFPELSPLPVSGIPSDLLKNRADLQAARHRLIANQWQESVAKADLLPSFTISAQALFSNGAWDMLFQNWVLSLGSSIAGSLFDGGTKKAKIKKVQSMLEGEFQKYTGLVSQAIVEVENSLVNLAKQKEYLLYLENQKNAQTETLDAAWTQYENGQAGFLNYLTARISSQQLELQIISETASYIKEHIQFYLVLGHDWTMSNDNN